MTGISPFARKEIFGLSLYKPGRPIEEIQRELGLKKVIKLASNENALGPSPLAIKAVQKELARIHRYPDSQSFYLKQKLAQIWGISASNIIVSNGSDEIINLILRAFLNKGDEVILAEPTFLIYEIASKIAGAKVVKVQLKDFRYDLEGMKRAITHKTKIVFIANPDNPTGTYVSREEIERFLWRLPKSTIVYFDEAYFEFAKDIEDFPDTLGYLKRNRNIILTRSFSKSYGLAGLRIGWGASSPQIIETLERVREPFNVNRLAQVAAAAALEDTRFLRQVLRVTAQGRRFLVQNLKKIGLEFIPSVTNFILVNVRQNSSLISRRLLERGIIVRDMKAWKLRGFIRVTIGTEQENERFIRTLRQVLKEVK
jgi:histidinol-phosphate aminotransferase